MLLINPLDCSNTIHAATRTRIQESLDDCPVLLRNAFLEALYATTQSFRQGPPPDPEPDAGLALRILSEWETEAGHRSDAVSLVHLQVLILLAMEADNHGPAALRGEHGGPSKASLLARAVAAAYAMGLQSAQADAASDVELDPDMNDRLALRAWWTLVALDRWNAAGTARPMLIPQDSLALSQGLKSLYGGESGYMFLSKQSSASS